MSIPLTTAIFLAQAHWTDRPSASEKVLFSSILFLGRKARKDGNPLRLTKEKVSTVISFLLK